MKKIFTLIAMAIMAVGANAQETIFSATATEALDVPGHSSDLQITSANATIDGGTLSAFSDQDDAKAMIKKQGGVFAFQCTNNNTYFKVTLNKALAAGDVISVRMQSRTDTDLGLWFSTEARGSQPASCIILVTADEQAWVDAPSYTVAEGDGICGSSSFFIYRHTGKSTYFTDLKITRSGATGINTVKTVAENGEAYNLAGQKVNKNFKGVVIQNGKKVVIK